MAKVTMSNMHLPLPEPLYSRLREEARRARRPATELAREAIDRWLTEERRRQISEAIQSYAQDVSGTEHDLDTRLEAAGIEHLLATVKSETTGP
jgi:hypothetical protein